MSIPFGGRDFGIARAVIAKSATTCCLCGAVIPAGEMHLIEPQIGNWMDVKRMHFRCARGHKHDVNGRKRNR